MATHLSVVLVRFDPASLATTKWLAKEKATEKVPFVSTTSTRSTNWTAPGTWIVPESVPRTRARSIVRLAVPGAVPVPDPGTAE